MPTKTYHKLIRDYIPEIINADGKICVCETLSDEDYIYLLDQKLNEELAEYQESKSLEELADLLEVMQTVVKARGWTLEELEQVRANKAAKRGGFEKKILLKEVYTLSDYQDLALKIQNNQKAIIEKIPPQMLNTYYWLQDNLYLRNVCNGVQREHNKKLNNGLPILHKVPPTRDYGRYFCIMAEKGGTSHGGLTEKLSPFFHAKKQEVNAYGR